MNLPQLWRKYYQQWVCGCFLIVLFMALQLLTLSPASPYGDAFKRLEGLGYDLRLKSTLPLQSRSFLPIVIVDIDEPSLKQVGRFPWSRHVMARLQSQLADAGVAVIAYDILFSEPELNPAQQVLSHLTDTLPAVSQTLQTLAPTIDADSAFSARLQDTDTVLGLLFEHQPDIRVGTLPETIFFSTVPASSLPVPAFAGHVANVPELQQQSPGSGFINSAPDSDGFIRNSMLLAKHQGQLYPALALEAARLYTMAEQVEVVTKPFGEGHSVEGIRLGTQLIPADDYGRVNVPYRGPAFSFPYVSAGDVLSGNIDTQLFDQAIVFVGTSAVGHADLRTTPVGVQYPGVEVHANVLEGLVFPELLPSRPNWMDGAVIMLLLISGLLCVIILPRLEVLGIAVFTLCLSGLFITFSVYLWVKLRLDLPQVAMLSMLISQAMILGSLGFVREHKERLQIKSIFDQYVPPAHIQAMLDNPDSVSMEGEKRDITVLFADIRSFTTISESLDAGRLKSYLNQYFSPITRIIFEHQGTIDKYVGDMVMAFWNAPLPVEHHPELAVRCAMAMQDQVDALQEPMRQQALPPFKIGIGLNTGDMNVGDMGSEYRRAYTVLGDAVNLGSRLEGLTKYYGVGILINETTQAQCPGLVCRPIDKVKVKGKNQAVTVYEPICSSDALTPALRIELESHQQAWTLYLSQQWQQALAAFTKLKELSPERKIYALMYERILTLQAQPPGEEWDGSYTHTSK
ncbi:MULTISPECIES: adenylate/guanylate cyclase domain-containing protein [unclassified Pseudoalteromonas]|uniref:CHASE2 domain-containing protein n=1 Tax=unclassified Pseudoalteromonas TaxID=194690 RepID=UPI0020976207|nr:adenylate/guanylate cyclase domain-containing protein [Pseudoalteromonas sp. XMcav2-N]MCO7190140.1 adenylate/guanylate cyclase domain-containing protein [Pseudoalteromonas sp. XMcav2-N]